VDNRTSGQYDKWTIGQVDNMTSGQYDEWTIGQVDNRSSGIVMPCHG